MFTKVKEPPSRDPQTTPPPATMTKRPPRSAPSIISADMCVVGTITAHGGIQVDGKVEGDITTESLTVGEMAVIDGEVIADEVVVRGRVNGSIKAHKVQLCSNSRVQGDILHAALAVETGAVFEGSCRHSDDPLGRKADKLKRETTARMEVGGASKDGDRTPPPKEPAAKPAEPAAERKNAGGDIGRINPGAMRAGATTS